MAKLENGVYIVLGEVNLLLTAIRRSSRWMSHSHQNDEDNEPLITNLVQLKNILNNIVDLNSVAPIEFLSPFLEVIRSEDTTGPITGLALTSVNKFLSYRLVDSNSESAANAIENIADAVTHARFVGTDPGSDEVVLMKILHVLRTLLLTPSGSLLTNESVCEIMQSCFRICFEMRLSELLRKSAEHTLVDMVQLLFSRIPQFKEDAKWSLNMRKLKMRTGAVMDPPRTGSKYRKKTKGKPVQHGGRPNQENSSTGDAVSGNTQSEISVPAGSEGVAEHHALVPSDIEDSTRRSVSPPDTLGLTSDALDAAISPQDGQPNGGDLSSMATTPVAGGQTVVNIDAEYQDEVTMQISTDPAQHETTRIEDESSSGPEQYVWIEDCNGEMVQVGRDATFTSRANREYALSSSTDLKKMGSVGENVKSSGDGQTNKSDQAVDTTDAEYINPRGIRFTTRAPHAIENGGPLVPYSLPCVRELLRFLISLISPVDSHNTDVMIHMGLSLLTIALESGADHMSTFKSLLALIKDDLCKNLFFLLKCERLSLFAASIRVCFLLFESMRCHLKLQMEMYFTKLMDIIISESVRVSYEQREIALESIVQLLRVPGLVTELYLNYDCDLYCTSLFEDLTKLLSKNAFPVSGLFSTHLLSLDALLAIVDSIEENCHHRILLTSKVNRNIDKESSKDPTTHGKMNVSTENIHEPIPKSTVPPPPPSSGFCMMGNESSNQVSEGGFTVSRETHGGGSRIRPNRMKPSAYIPNEEELAAIKYKKKIYQIGTEQFNSKPQKGISFLQEHGLFSNPLEPGEVVNFLKENPKLDKKQIGEFISSRKNSNILEAYQKSFNFEGTRIDEALRMFLETFRLPGEAPVISYILEHFADHWHKLNGEPFANADAAFTLAYAVIMLNVDQHNTNAKKQNVPMTSENFKKNLTKVNGGQDFDEDMLDEMFQCVKNDEIVMPAEQTGIVKDNYMWKVLLRRGTTKDSEFIHAATGAFDRDLFAIVWGPTVAALSFVFDKSSDEQIIQKAISGFRKCAMVSAHYGMSDVFDNLVISLCKFTTLLSSSESLDTIAISFGNNSKAQLAARTVFGLAHRHSDILHDGWKNILDCILQLYRAKLLAEVLVKVEDFLDPNGRISLMREEAVTQHRADSGVLSSFYSYFALTETPQQRGPTPEDQEAIKRAQDCILECHVEQLIIESKFLQVDSLQELLKALIFASRCPDIQDSIHGQQCDEDAAVLFLELLMKVVLQNRDRIVGYWQNIQDHLYNLIVNASEHTFLTERAVVGLLRLAVRLLRREEIALQVLRSLRILLMMKPEVIHSLSKHIAFGLHDLLKTNAANIHSSQDWCMLFTLLEVVGAGTDPPPVMQVCSEGNVAEVLSDAGAQSDSEVNSARSQVVEDKDRGYTSDSELYGSENSRRGSGAGTDSKVSPTNNGSWYMVYYREEMDKHLASSSVNQYSITMNEALKHHDIKSLSKCCETLAFLVRDAAHVTPHNFESCIHTIRVFVEASVDGGGSMSSKDARSNHKLNQSKKSSRKQSKKEMQMRKSRSSPSHLATSNRTDSDDDSDADSYQTISIQLLDLMHTLHTRAATIFMSWAEEEKWQREQRGGEHEPNQTSSVDQTAIVQPQDNTNSLWGSCWCPLLQGIARLCCDTRRQVRSQALTYLQRALLVHDLQTLHAAEWESCFNKVLFPLLSKLLDNIDQQDPNGVEETRMRASTLLCKVFLQHLTPLLNLSTFTALWLTILDFMDKYMHLERSDLLWEAIPESLKNMLLVMHTAGILQQQDETEESQLWKLTWDRINTFLPNLREEVFKPHDPEQRRITSRDPSPTPAVQTQQPQSSVSVTSSNSSPDLVQPQLAASNQTTEISETGSKMAESFMASTSPLNSGMHQYILHPPLPAVSNLQPAGTGLPLILNPDMMQSTAIPVISPPQAVLENQQ